MKVYKYTVSQVTPRGKHINVFEKVIQSEMSYIELSDYLSDKYTGFVVSVEEIKEIETIGSTSKRTYMSYEKMYEHCIDLNFNLDYSKDDEFIKLIELNRDLIKLKEKDLLEEYVQFARLHIDTYRCSCGSLGRIGYLCSNKKCKNTLGV